MAAEAGSPQGAKKAGSSTEPRIETSKASKGAAKKAPYRKPVLTEYGDLRDRTLGPSPGIGESGNPAVFRA